MRKLCYLFSVIMALAFVGYGIYNETRMSTKSFSEFMLANVEALAIGEWTPNGWTCFRYVEDDVTSDVFFVCIKCQGCETMSATYASYSGYCWH